MQITLSRVTKEYIVQYAITIVDTKHIHFNTAHSNHSIIHSPLHQISIPLSMLLRPMAFREWAKANKYLLNFFSFDTQQDLKINDWNKLIHWLRYNSDVSAKGSLQYYATLYWNLVTELFGNYWWHFWTRECYWRSTPAHSVVEKLPHAIDYRGCEFSLSQIDVIDKHVEKACVMFFCVIHFRVGGDNRVETENLSQSRYCIKHD